MISQMRIALLKKRIKKENKIKEKKEKEKKGKGIFTNLEIRHHWVHAYEFQNFESNAISYL